MTDNPINFGRQFKPPGMAGATLAPQNVSQVTEPDLPPGAEGSYYGGPLANPPPTPTPAPQSLQTLAAGGTNHQESWTNGQASPAAFPKQAPFSAIESDLPPGMEGTYAGGPLANPPKPSPTPNQNLLKKFSWSSAFDDKPAY